MSYKYFPHTDSDIGQMLQAAGVKSLDELYSDVPEELRHSGDYALPEAMSELEVRELFRNLATLNSQLVCFAGGGCYDHYAPSIVERLASRSEFLTSYTPYQAEISQGTLHYIFEYQSMMALLTGMDISNASMYDGATATAEAVMMAMAATKKTTRVVVSGTVDARTRRVVDTYAHYHGIEICTIEPNGGVSDREAIRSELARGGVAGVVVQQPNCFGIVEDYSGYGEACHEAKALLIMNSVASDLAILKTPAEWEADIAVGEAQSLGLPMMFGGPGLGYMCTTEKLMRKMPGRIVGMTSDNRGQRAFVLTLQAREQHIRRQKATSNICSNQSLMALYATIYLATMGRQGLREAAEQSYQKAHDLCDMLTANTHFKLKYDQPFFNEFCLTFDGNIDDLLVECESYGYMAGVKVDDNTLMIAVTEKRTAEEMAELVEIINRYVEEKL